MAFTFAEVHAELTDPKPRFNFATCVVVVTQEDGRTAYGSPQVVFMQDAGLGVGLSGGLSLVFSDRQDEDQRFASDKADRVTVRMFESTSGRVQAAIRLDSWGGQIFSVELDYPRSGVKILQGYGPPMGNASGQALYCISFPSLELLG